MQPVFWLKNPLILIDKNHITQLWPEKNMQLEDKLNAMTRFILVLTILGFIFTNSTKVIISGVVTLAVIIMLYFSKSNNKKITLDDLKREGFTNREVYENLKPNFTTPTSNNPMMNVLVNEYGENPQRKQAAPSFNQEVTEDINEAVKKNLIEEQNVDPRLFQNLGDNFVFDQSMRNFYTTPNTKIPNDQKGFAEFCYGTMVSCKEGNEFACERNMYKNPN
tara:strand:- start:35 stop:697 length:663 start_codon:yes stop_codon:yes gene_type:complete